MNDTTLVCGCQIQIDRSGCGHAWQDVDADSLPASVREEIATEIIGGGREECGNYVASNGLHYRWSN